MTEEIQMCLDEAREGMDKAIAHLQSELTKIRAGKANPSMLDSILVEAYGTQTPLNQVANVNTPDARTLSIQPWDKSTLEAIEKGIMMANIGLTPQNDGEMIRLNIPPLTEERRKEMVKTSRAMAEDCRISIRTIRKDANDVVKMMEKDGLSEDMAKDAEGEVQKVTDSYSAKIDELMEKKESEIMTV